MKIFETWRTWLVIIGLLLFSGLASVAYLALEANADEAADVDTDGGGDVVSDINLPFFGDTGGFDQFEPVTIQLDEYLLGEVLVEVPGLRELNGREVHPLLLSAVLAAIFLGGLFLIGLPLALIYVRLDQQTTLLKEDPEFKEAQAELEQRQKEQIKEMAEGRPTAELNRSASRWPFAITAFIVLLFVFFFGLALADTFFPDGDIELGANSVLSPTVPVALLLSFLAFLVLAFMFRNVSPSTTEETGADTTPIPWGIIWVIVTGLIFVGIGIGLMLALGAG